MENNNILRNCNDEAIIKIISKLTLEFEDFKDLDKQVKLKSLLEESLYEYDIKTTTKELIVSDIEDKMDMYIQCRRLEYISERTLYNYKLILKKFASCFNKTISRVNANDIRMFLAIYQSQGIKASTINSKIFCLRKFFSWLLDNEYISTNPMNKIKIAKIPKRLKQVMTDKQLETLKEGCVTIRERALLEFASSTGCRVSEISDACISNINFAERSILIIGKGNKQRKVFFSTKAEILIEQYLKERKVGEDTDALFVGGKFPYKRLKPRSIQLAFNKVKDRVGLSDVDFITCHGYRRWCFTTAMKHRMELSKIQRLAGHSSPETTLRYIDITDNDLKLAYETSM